MTSAAMLLFLSLCHAQQTYTSTALSFLGPSTQYAAVSLLTPHSSLLTLQSSLVQSSSQHVFVWLHTHRKTAMQNKFLINVLIEAILLKY